MIKEVELKEYVLGIIMKFRGILREKVNNLLSANHFGNKK